MTITDTATRSNVSCKVGGWRFSCRAPMQGVVDLRVACTVVCSARSPYDKKYVRTCHLFYRFTWGLLSLKLFTAEMIDVSLTDASRTAAMTQLLRTKHALMIPASIPPRVACLRQVVRNTTWTKRHQVAVRKCLQMRMLWAERGCCHQTHESSVFL